MLNSEKISVLLDRMPRRIVATWNLPERREFREPGVAAWRSTHTDSHSYREFMMSLTGPVVQALEGVVYREEPGTLFLYDSEEKHDRGYSPACPDGSHIWFFVMPDLINCVGDELKAGSYSVDFRYCFRSPEVVKYLNAVWEKAAKKLVSVELAQAEINALVNLIAAELVQALSPAEPGEAKSSTDSHQQEMIKEIMKYLDRNCGRDTDVVSLARMAGYSRPHFLRLFRQYAGCRVHEYIDKCRISTYEKLIRQGIPMKNIAGELGFSSTAALGHWRKGKF